MWIKFDIPQINYLHECYQGTIYSLEELMEDINWNSRLEVKDYFKEIGFELDNLQINYLKGVKECIGEEFEELHDIFALYIERTKLKYLIKNYIQCILTHADENGIVQLRLVEGEWRLPNKRPLPYMQEIKDAIIESNVPNI